MISSKPFPGCERKVGQKHKLLVTIERWKDHLGKFERGLNRWLAQPWPLIFFGFCLLLLDFSPRFNVSISGCSTSFYDAHGHTESGFKHRCPLRPASFHLFHRRFPQRPARLPDPTSLLPSCFRSAGGAAEADAGVAPRLVQRLQGSGGPILQLRGAQGAVCSPLRPSWLSTGLLRLKGLALSMQTLFLGRVCWKDD